MKLFLSTPPPPPKLEGPTNSLNLETTDMFVTSQSISDMEESQDVINMSKDLKPAVEGVVPAKLNETNGDCHIRKLFGTPESKELLVQDQLKVNLAAIIINNNKSSPQASRMIYLYCCIQ
jgi:hypothetical protein